MKKNINKFGFTLIELMIAIVLFSVLSIATYTLLKNTMDSGLQQKAQQSANENAKNLLKMIAYDLKSSTVVNYRTKLQNSTSIQDEHFFYPSSVFYPTISQCSSTTRTDEETPMGLVNDNAKQTMRNNTNRIGFYAKNMFDLQAGTAGSGGTVGQISSTNNVRLQAVLYSTHIQNDKCLVVRQVFTSDTSVLFNTLPGIKLEDGTVDLCVDTRNYGFENNFNQANRFNQTNNDIILRLPNRGDVAMIYLARAMDDTMGVNTRKFATNQYVLKVMVFQTVKGLSANRVPNLDTYFDADCIPTEAFTDLFTDNETNNNSNSLRNNYKYAELTTSVGVFAPSSN